MNTDLQTAGKAAACYIAAGEIARETGKTVQTVLCNELLNPKLTDEQRETVKAAIQICTY